MTFDQRAFNLTFRGIWGISAREEYAAYLKKITGWHSRPLEDKSKEGKEHYEKVFIL